MKISRDKIAYLLKVYSDGEASVAEEQELFNWVDKGKKKPIREHIKELISSYNFNHEEPSVDWEQIYEQIVAEKNHSTVQPVIRKMARNRWIAAAAVLLLLMSGYYFLDNNLKPDKLAATQQPKQNDIAPPNSVNAVIILSNGQKILLDSIDNGTLAVQGSVNVSKLSNGEIAYKGISKEVQYNTLSNPKGSKVVSLILADGSKIWLNTASSLKYPTAFSGNERKVELTGEAYMEIAHNSAVPFLVANGNTIVRVLGTHFNVNAYDDEAALKVTLLEGSVSVKSSMQPKVIEPGEQALVNKNGMIAVENSIDVNEVMAWKNGFFTFKGTDIESIMRQVSRWYNVDVIFEKPVSEKFYADVSKNTSLSSLLNMLEATKAIQFKIEGKTIKVMTPTLR